MNIKIMLHLISCSGGARHRMTKNVTLDLNLFAIDLRNALQPLMIPSASYDTGANDCYMTKIVMLHLISISQA